MEHFRWMVISLVAVVVHLWQRLVSLYQAGHRVKGLIELSGFLNQGVFCRKKKLFV